MTLSTWFSIMALTVTSASGADWPQWRGPHRTGVVDPKDAIAALPDDPKLVWKVAIGEGFASPVVVGGKLFILENEGKQEMARALDAATGKDLWREPVFESHKDGFGIGPRTTPVVDGDRVYFQSARGELQCRATTDGKLLWRTNFVTDFGASYVGEKGSAAGASRHGATGSPLIDGNKLIAQVGGPDGAGIVAFDKTDGKVLWKSQNDPAAYAAPIMATIGGVPQFVSFTVDGLIGLDPKDGTLLWRHPMKTRLGRHVVTPVVVNDTVIISSHTLGLVGVTIAKEGTGFVAKAAWVNAKIMTNFASPVIVGTHLYGLGSSKDLICVDTATGQPTWTQTGLINTSAEQAVAAFLVIGKNIAALTDSGELALYAADPAAFREIGRVQVCGKTWCNPAIVQGKIYVRDAKDLFCFDLK